MPLRVTFDTNVLDLACRPDRFPKDHRQPQMHKIKDALVAGTIQGFTDLMFFVLPMWETAMSRIRFWTLTTALGLHLTMV